MNIESAQERNSSKNSSKNYGGSVGYDLASGAITGDANFGKSKGNSESVVQHNSHITGSGNISINSGGDTNIKGGKVAGKGGIADIGGDLNIESRQDTVHVRNKSDSYSMGTGAARNTGGAYDMGDWNIGYSKDRSKYDYASVIEQSGIYAGEGGFDIKVKNNTDLKGAVIAGEAESAKNRLETGSLTTSDIENYAHAEAKTEGFSWTGGADLFGAKKRAAAKRDRDMETGLIPVDKNAEEYQPQFGGSATKTGFEGKYWDGEYGAVKNVVSNLLDNGSASKTTHGETKSAVAVGTVVITDAEAQKAKTGLTPEESIARLRRDTEGTQTAAAQIDLGKLEQKAQDERAMKKGIVDEAYKTADKVYNIYSNKKADFYEVIKSKDGKPIIDENGDVLMRKLLPEEINKLTPSEKTGLVQVFTNGINNDEDAAAKYAALMARDKNGPSYFVYNPTTYDPFAEVVAAAYSKVFESDVIGLSNATKKIKEIEDIYGHTNLDLYGHSRGTLPIQNSMRSQLRAGNTDVLKGTSITYYGSAANAENGADLYSKLGGKDGYIRFEGEKYDLVHTAPFVGNNPYTFEPEHDKGGLLKTLSEWKRIFSDKKARAHNCYNGSGNGCADRYGKPQFGYAYPDKVVLPDGHGGYVERKWGHK